MVAEQKVRELENSAVELSITVPKDVLKNAYTQVVQKYVKSLQIPGFRKGKAPASVLEQKIGPGMREESMYNVIEDAVKEALEKIEDKYKPLPYSTPSIVDEENLPKEIDNDLVFAVSYDVLPLFELPPYTGLSVEVPKVVVSEEVVEKEIDRLRDQNSMVVEKDGAVASGDIVTVDYVELDAEKNEVEGTKREDFIFTVGSGTNFYKIDDDIVGMKKDDAKDIVKTYPEDFEETEYAGKSITLKVKIKQIKFRDVPELDDEFAQDVSEQYKTVEDLRKATKDKLEASLQGHLDEVRLEALMDKILEQTSIAIPASMVEVEVDSSWRRFVSQSGMPENQILKYLEFQGQTKEDFTAQWRDGAERRIRVQLIMDKIKEKEDFKIEESELNSMAEEQLKDITDENTKSYYRAMIEDDMKLKRTGEFLLANNSVADGEEISYDQFMSGHMH
ncbi:MAG: trigger factor [Sphaerochaetaceae bacterium]|jgi:trigger factor|nr:trigger factor [Sphaerochaetaceae bacterium]NLO59667.1 trigger factor [Spirochaetales bacterium]MDD3669772.1 trigger factor [Sphaerochaetaceae bacterium]MDD4259188.1 trigger factor [Sphaerochaetaceae bacterium]MDD4762820.1 trigger factor [Sphaerochaetaceae bacterium]